MWERLIVLVLLVTPFCARAEGVLVLGDSISAAYGIEETQGWVHLLRQRLETQCSGLPVNNASVSGDTSDGGLVRLPDLLERHQPDTVVIELGGNDGLRGLPPQRLGDNLTRMIELSEAAGADSGFGTPDSSATYRLEVCRCLKCCVSRSSASSDLATRSNPVVPRSSRCSSRSPPSTICTR